MRRALPAAGFTAAALLMLSRFHTAPAASGTKLQPASPPTTALPGQRTDGSIVPSTTGSSSGAAVPTTARDGTFTGPEVQTRWGPVQVKIVVQGGKLADVQAVEVPNSHDRSVEINDQAAPILRDEALTAQSANLDLVSGATITWDGYRQSLQAAIDLARR